jgi:hypothetical protein
VGGIKISVVYTVQDTDGKILFSYLTAWALISLTVPRLSRLVIKHM